MQGHPTPNLTGLGAVLEPNEQKPSNPVQALCKYFNEVDERKRLLELPESCLAIACPPPPPAISSDSQRPEYRSPLAIIP